MCILIPVTTRTTKTPKKTTTFTTIEPFTWADGTVSMARVTWRITTCQLSGIVTGRRAVKAERA